MNRVFACALLCLAPVAAVAEVTCAELQAAFRVPPPAASLSLSLPGGLGKCSRAELDMFEINGTALAEAQPVTDLAEVHGTWLGDRVLSYLLGITVPGQEVIVIEPGEVPDSLNIRQYWMKSVSPPGNAPLWSEDGDYLGLVAEAKVERDRNGRLADTRYGEGVRYSGMMVEFERSHDLLVKSDLNHFEMPFALRLLGDVLVLDGERRLQPSRETREYARSYTRIAPEAAELALATVAVLELSQTQNFDCLAHQITEGEGPFIDALAPRSLAEFAAFAEGQIRRNVQRTALTSAMRAAEDDTERASIQAELMALLEVMQASMSDPETREFVKRLITLSGTFCPDFF